MNILLSLIFVYFLSFTDKNGSETVSLGERALEQRERWGIEIDSLDYEVSPVYLDSIRSIGARVLHTSRWMNGATVELSEDSDIMSRLGKCSFISGIELTEDDTGASEMPVRDGNGNSGKYGNALNQTIALNAVRLHEEGYQGQGIRIAILDGGFTNFDSLPAFDSIRSRVIGCYDFTGVPEDMFGPGMEHGSQCLSIMAAVTDDYYGMAVGAEYCLMRTEDFGKESPKETDNMVAALEKADSLGVNIVSTSLGYSTFDNPAFDFSYSEMDGRTYRCSRAATIAARKGMLFCNSAGNEGRTEWHYLTVPADADSTLTVGAVDSTLNIAWFSSRGPSYDGRIKPEVCAVGLMTSLVSPDTGEVNVSVGTSFATPQIAGIAACIWSAFPEENAMQIRQRIIRSADRYEMPDYDYGYGIPDAWAACNGLPSSVIRVSERNDRSGIKTLINGVIRIIRDGRHYDISGSRADTIQQ